MKQTNKTLILCLLIGFLSLQLFAIKPDRKYRFYPEKLSLIYKDLDVVTSDGVKIKAWFFPAQLTPSEQEISASWENPIKKSYKNYLRYASTYNNYCKW